MYLIIKLAYTQRVDVLMMSLGKRSFEQLAPDGQRWYTTKKDMSKGNPFVTKIYMYFDLETEQGVKI